MVCLESKVEKYGDITIGFGAGIDTVPETLSLCRSDRREGL